MFNRRKLLHSAQKYAIMNKNFVLISHTMRMSILKGELVMKKLRKTLLSVLLVCALLLTCVIPAFSLTTEQTDDTEAPERSLTMRLELAITADKEAYELEDTLLFTLAVTNNTDDTIYDAVAFNIVNMDLKLKNSDIMLHFGDIEPGATVTKTIEVVHAVYDTYGNDGIGTALATIDRVFSIFKTVIAALFTPYFPNIEDCDILFAGKTMGLLSVAYGYTLPSAAPEEPVSELPSENEQPSENDAGVDVPEEESGINENPAASAA